MQTDTFVSSRISFLQLWIECQGWIHHPVFISKEHFIIMLLLKNCSYGPEWPKYDFQPSLPQVSHLTIASVSLFFYHLLQTTIVNLHFKTLRDYILMKIGCVAQCVNQEETRWLPRGAWLKRTKYLNIYSSFHKIYQISRRYIKYLKFSVVYIYLFCP